MQQQKKETCICVHLRHMRGVLKQKKNKPVESAVMSVVQYTKKEND